MKPIKLLTVRLETSADVVLVRQRAQTIAEIADFDSIRQTSFATAISEIARNALQFGSNPQVHFLIDSMTHPARLSASVIDEGPGIKEVRARGGTWDHSITFKGQGIASARKLVKSFSIECPASGGTIVNLGLPFPQNFTLDSPTVLAWSERLAEQRPRNLLEEMNHRNQELVVALETLQAREIELERRMAEDEILRTALAESRELLEARVIERTESLLTSNEELRAFSYTVSHDLRAPLRAINGFLQLLLEDHVPPGDTAAAEIASNIFRATTRMDSLIGDLVAYTQAFKVGPQVASLEPKTLILDLIKQSEAWLRPALVKVHTLGDFPPVTANSSLLVNSLNNLLDNALKFRKPTQELSITFRGQPREEHLRIWVEDNGIGISPEHHERIFRVFERLHGYDVPGTGIGLALVRRWIDSMNGTVGVESEFGHGARLWIDLPLAPHPPLPPGTLPFDTNGQSRNDEQPLKIFPSTVSA